MKLNKIYQGDALKVLKEMPDCVVDCVMTSPPYWSLRDYGSDPQIWDGDENCEHEWKQEITSRPNSSGGQTEWAKNKLAIKGVENYSEFTDYNDRKTESNFCIKCGAWKGELGLEPTFGLYIQHLCNIFDEVKRVLKDTGVIFVNLSDTYASGGGLAVEQSMKRQYAINTGAYPDNSPNSKLRTLMGKSLCCIPERFMIEMINRGWILRNKIVWHKKNCMPSSAKDRFTVDWEYLLFFSKNKRYYFEQQFEYQLESSINRMQYDFGGQPGNIHPGEKREHPFPKEWTPSLLGRNKRCVWQINSKGFPEAHFAVFPEKLCLTPILAGCPEFVCKKCGRAREKILEKGRRGEEEKGRKGYDSKYRNDDCGQSLQGFVRDGSVKQERDESRIEAQKLYPKSLKKQEQYINFIHEHGKITRSVGFRYTDCGCGVEFEAGVVLDPFMGSGTVAVVSIQNKRNWIGIELKAEYIEMAKKRIAKARRKKKIKEIYPASFEKFTEMKGSGEQMELNI